MSCEEISPQFEIEIVFKEVTIRTAESEGSPIGDFLKVDLECLGQNIEGFEQEEKESSISLADGCHSVDLRFKLKNESNEISNEEFTFKLLGDPIIGKIICNRDLFDCFFFYFSELFEAFKQPKVS
jgi:hypothetical protein